MSGGSSSSSPHVLSSAGVKRRGGSPTRFASSSSGSSTGIPGAMPLSLSAPLSARHNPAAGTLTGMVQTYWRGLTGAGRRSVLRTAVVAAVVLPTLYVLLGRGADVPGLESEAQESLRRSSGVGTGVGGAVRGLAEVAGGAGKWFGGVGRGRRGGGASASEAADWDELDHNHLSGSGGSGTGSGEIIWDIEDEIPVSSYDGGIAGYTVWSNLYLSAGAFLFVEPDSGPSPLSKKLPGTRQILSGARKPGGGYGAAEEDRWRIAAQEVASGELEKRAVYLRGITYVFNDEPGGNGYLIYFRHFVYEAFLGATRVFAHVLDIKSALGGSRDSFDKGGVPLPSRVWFPRCGWKPSWRDDKGDNAWFLAHAIPGATVEDANGWDDRLTAGLPIIFERVVLIDRWAAHSAGGESGKWGKMSGDAAALKTPMSFWNGIRRNTMRSLAVDGPSAVGKHNLPVVVYIDTQTGDPKLQEASRTALIEALKTLTPIAEVHVTKLLAMTKAQQVELISRAEIVIGQHTDDMLQMMWMPATKRSTIIEIFEENGFDRSFEIFATSLNHKYIAVQNDRALTEAEWRANGGKRGPNQKGPIPVDGPLIARLVRETLVGNKAGSGLRDQSGSERHGAE